MLLETRTGEILSNSGSVNTIRSEFSGAFVSQDAHGRFNDAAFYSRLFSAGGGLIAINNVTFTLATLGATATPIVGLWNPFTSPNYVSVLQASLATIMTALQNTGPGGYVWAFSVGNAGLTLGTTGWNRKTLSQAGNFGRAFVGGLALTGLTNNLVVAEGSALGGGSSYNAALLGTAAGFQTQQVTSVENFDGGLIIPPGGVIALLATTTPVAHSVVPKILWEEFKITT